MTSGIDPWSSGGQHSPGVAGFVVASEASVEKLAPSVNDVERTLRPHAQPLLSGDVNPPSWWPMELFLTQGPANLLNTAEGLLHVEEETY